MSKNRIDILSTGPLDQNLLSIASSHNINIEVIPFIQTKSNLTVEVKERVKTLLSEKRTVVFTSINAVNAVSELFLKPPQWDIYSMENATLNLILEKFNTNKEIRSAADAMELADKIIQSKRTNQITFFCGNLRRDELPDKLRENGITVEQIIVYQTLLTPVRVQKKYDGIIFYSPSAVKSFFSLNAPGPESELFAIGHTTGRSISTHSSRKVIVAERSDKQYMIEKVIAHFNT